MEQQCNQLQQLIYESNNTVFFGGAGVSTESGIPDFRSAGGLYTTKKHLSPETILSAGFFHRDPAYFYEFYRDTMLHLTAQPNPAHMALAKLEAAGKLQAVITQNIDGLHQAAGSQNVLELHGSVHRNYCCHCRAEYDATFIKNSNSPPLCFCGGLVKPDVVLYQEPLEQTLFQKAVSAIRKAELFIIAGTSLEVHPAAGLADYFAGEHLVIINTAQTPRDNRASLVIQHPVAKVLDKIMNKSNWF